MLNNLLHQLEESIIAILLAVMTLVTFSQVIARYFFNSGAVWALQLTTYCFAWMILFGMSYGVRVSAHIGVDVFVKLLPIPLQRPVSILAVLLCMTYCVLLCYGGIIYVYTIYEVGIDAEDLHIKQWIIYTILPIGLILLLFRFTQVLYKLIIGVNVQILADEANDTIKEQLSNVQTLQIDITTDNTYQHIAK